MIKFPSIEQFRNVIRELKLRWDYQGKDENDEPTYRNTKPYPIVKFEGTVKLHGTNAGIVKYKDGTIKYQSRERVITPSDDNSGFATAMSAKNLNFLFEGISFTDHIAIFGEWCGGNIQDKVAICQLPKMFVLFGCKVDGEWVDYFKGDAAQGIYNILDFKTFTVEIDFNAPELIQNHLIDLTIAVEEECPVGKSFDVSGIGEGIVWTAQLDGHRYAFKTKGEKHSGSKVKKLASVDVEEIESIKEFVDYSLTESRLKQGLDKLREMGKPSDQTSTGDYLRWIVGDINKEEADTIAANGLDVKKLNSAISAKARQWYLNNF